MARNNRHGIFSNQDDNLADLRQALAEHRSDTTVSVTGCVGLFAGRWPGEQPADPPSARPR